MVPKPDQSDEFVANWKEKVTSYDKMDLKDELIHAMCANDFRPPSEIQSLAIRPICTHRNVVACAPEMSGKTSALAIGILNNINIESKETQALVISPMGMLAQHSYNIFVEIGSRMSGLEVHLFNDDSSREEDQKAATSCPHIAVATPDRALDLIRTENLNMQQLQMLCLDDADELLKGDLQEQVSEIIGLAGPHVQFLLFSTKITDPVFALMKGITDPVQIKVEAQGTLVPQYFVNVGEEQYKLETLIDIHRLLDFRRAVVFVNSRNTVDELQAALEDMELFSVSALHSGLSQSDCDSMLQRFMNGETRILVTTDDFAKCIDFRKITLVFNHDLPDDVEQYRRRVSRFAYGKTRVAINFFCDFSLASVEDCQIILNERYHTHMEPLPMTVSMILPMANEPVE